LLTLFLHLQTLAVVVVELLAMEALFQEQAVRAALA
jgi:hypothetical protein